MDKFKKSLPAILLILFEIAVGILLLINPRRFTIGVFIIFGAVLILCAVLMLIRYLKARKAADKAASEAKKAAQKSDSPTVETEPVTVSLLPLIAAVVTFVLGAIFAFGSGVLYDWTALLVIFYGAIMVIKGVFKITDYVSIRKAGGYVTFLRFIIGVLSIALGIVLIVFHRDARDTVFRIAAISLLVEAALDIATLLIGVRYAKKTVKVDVKDTKELDDGYVTEDFSK